MPNADNARSVAIDANAVWSRICRRAGEPFHLIRGKEFRYEARSAHLILAAVSQNLARSQLEQALELVPLSSTVDVQHLRAPSYIYAILMDDRVRRSDW